MMFACACPKSGQALLFLGRWRFDFWSLALPNKWGVGGDG